MTNKVDTVKKFFCTVAAAFALVSTVLHAADPADFIPAGMSVVSRYDCVQLKKLSWVADLVKEKFPATVKLIACFDQMSILFWNKLGNSSGKIIYAAGEPDEDSGIVLFNIKVPESEFVQCLKGLPASVKYGESEIAGCKLYTFSTENIEGTVALVYLAEDVVMLTLLNEDIANLILRAKKRSGNQLVKSLNNRAALSLVMQGDPDGNSPASFADMVLNINDKQNAQQTLLNLKANVLFREKHEARNIIKTLRLAVPAAASAIFSKDPRLLGDVIAGWRVSGSGNVVNFKFSIIRQNLEKVISYLADPANREVLEDAMNALRSF